MTEEKKYEIAIAIPCYQHPKYQFVQSFLHLWKPQSSGVIKGATHLFQSHAILIEEARHAMTLGFLRDAPEATHLLFIDDDMVFQQDALKRLLEHNLPIVGGLCHNRRKPYQPILARKFPEWMGLTDRYGFLYHYEPGSLVEVDATGGAFILIKREVFEAIEEKYGTVWWQKWKGLSEDFSFCDRAKECGYKVVVDTGLEIGHVAEVIVDSGFAKKNREAYHDGITWTDEPPRQEGDNAPLASIVIPTYNQQPKHLNSAVLSAACQSVPTEVIVVDDGSDPPIVRPKLWPSNVRLIRHETNKGIAEALNTGISSVKSPIFMWLSSDDLFDYHKVKNQLRAMQQAGAKASFTRWQSVNDLEPHARLALFPVWRNRVEQIQLLNEACVINGSTVAIEMSVFGKVGMFDPTFRYAQDWDLWQRIAVEFSWLGVDESLVTRREFGNLTAAIEAEAPDGPRRSRRDEEDRMLKNRIKID